MAQHFVIAPFDCSYCIGRWSRLRIKSNCMLMNILLYKFVPTNSDLRVHHICSTVHGYDIIVPLWRREVHKSVKGRLEVAHAR